MRSFAKDLSELRLKLTQLPRDKHGCWIWQGSTSEGYGNIRIRGKRDRTHRLAYRVFVGPVPRGLCVLHTCDNRRCCNPQHLTLGTKAQNMAEMYERERQSTSEQRRTYGNRKLTEDDVRNIDRLHAEGIKRSKIAAQYNMSESAINKVIRRQSWQHVPKG